MSRRVARPYAAAFYQVVEKRGGAALREVERQLAAVARVFADQPGLLRTFEVPSVTPAKKRELLAAIGKALELSPETRRLLAALAQHYRLRALGDVTTAFRELVDRREGIVRGRVALPAPPTTTQVQALADVLGHAMGAKVLLETEVKPDLLAGFVVRLGSRVFDGSLRTQLVRFAAAGSGR